MKRRQSSSCHGRATHCTATGRPSPPATAWAQTKEPAVSQQHQHSLLAPPVGQLWFWTQPEGSLTTITVWTNSSYSKSNVHIETEINEQIKIPHMTIELSKDSDAKQQQRIGKYGPKTTNTTFPFWNVDTKKSLIWFIIINQSLIWITLSCQVTSKKCITGWWFSRQEIILSNYNNNVHLCSLWPIMILTSLKSLSKLSWYRPV